MRNQDNIYPSKLSRDELLKRHRIKALFREKVICNDKFTKVQFRSMMALLEHHNVETNRCDPSETSIAKNLGVNRSWLNQTVKRLEADGWLNIHNRGYRSSCYTFNWNREGKVFKWWDNENTTPSKTNTGVGFLDTSPGEKPTPVLVFEEPTGEKTDSNMNMNMKQNMNVNKKGTLLSDSERSSSAGVSPSSQNDDGDLATFEQLYSQKWKLTSTVNDEKSLQEDDTGCAGAAGAADDTFARFWQAYPERKGGAAAKREFAKVTKTVDAELLIQAALRYARSREGKAAPHYFKHAANWLKDECWKDHDATLAANAPDYAPPPRTRTCQNCHETFKTNDDDLEFYCDGCHEEYHEGMGAEYRRCMEEQRRMEAEREYNNDLY